jgi:hypothetical protein
VVLAFNRRTIRRVDAMLSRVQAGTQESQAMRSHSLRVRLGMVGGLAMWLSITYLNTQENREDTT